MQVNWIQQSISTDSANGKRPKGNALGIALLSVCAACLVVGFKGQLFAQDYLQQIKPLLQARCTSCHGALKQAGGLRLDTAQGAANGGDSGPALRPGNAMESILIQRVKAEDAEDRMPPEHEGEPLTDEQIAILRDWIDSGASLPHDEQAEADPRDHWSFRPLRRPTVPEPHTQWVHNAIDAFVAAKHHEVQVQPQSEAHKLVLLRRRSIDLIGLPPTLDEIDQALADSSDDWYQRTAERLLDDPRHGQRWARHWMDIWRYSDWWGLGDQLRNSQKHIWHWRDWIIDSLNDDLPYDQMIRLMLAADELHPNDLDKLRATGFLARNYFLFNRPQWMDETVEHVSKSLLGLTMNCVRCHDHKYDPFPQVDYYRLRAFFEPYHARLDMLPGQPDLEKDGLARVFDAWPDEPTYLYVRGDEKRPDKSQAIAPGVPTFLAANELPIQAIDLPVEAWQPERRKWVTQAYRDAALHKLTSAQRSLEQAVLSSTASGADGDKVRSAQALVEVAQAELASVEMSIRAWQAIWDEQSADLRSETRLAAVCAQRAAQLAQAEYALIDAEIKFEQAAEDKKESAQQAIQAARDTLQKASEQAGAEVSDQELPAPFEGAKWTATRFLNSTADDPAPAFGPKSTGRRTALAGWITDLDNPLTARVAVNHLWTRHFGTPLVSTVFDFGRKGSPPTQPELLDWLASELIDNHWSMKHIHRLIVHSATYRMSSSWMESEDNRSKDPDNQAIWCRTPTRLESQAVRDSLLALAGQLDCTMGGPPVPADQQTDSKRRSLYFFHSNNDRNLFLTTFDEALVTDCYRREQSIVPQQALAMTNSGLVLDLAKPIAENIWRKLLQDQSSKPLTSKTNPTSGAVPSADQAFTRLAFQFLLAQHPTEGQLSACLRSLATWRELPEAGQAESEEQFAWTNLVWVLLNHHDFVVLN
ncbi:MAG TPA: hypothetical protein DCF63_12370 [Planctomycetaceae bacterium]|nr:hypothetical protein [Planctomycetaceae bacterium]